MCRADIAPQACGLLGRNVSFVCHGTTGVYVTSRGVSSDVITSGIAVLADDPACK